MRIQLISRDNGYGLSKDVAIMRSVLEPLGHEVDFTPWNSPRQVARHHYDANVFLELLNPVFFGQARSNYFVPNAEWTLPEWTKHFGGIDLILAKTHDAERIFSTVRPTRYIGFTSPDIWSDAPKNNVVLHLEGQSIAKGTEQVKEAARLLPDIEFVFPKGPPDQIRIWQCTSAIHCQPSTYEGFGHVINEAKSCGAVVITTACEPMTDLVDSSFGFGVPHCSEKMDKHGLAIHKIPCVDGLVEAIRNAYERTDKAELGMIARQSYLDGKAFFTERMKELFPA